MLMLNICPPKRLVYIRPFGGFVSIVLFEQGLSIFVIIHLKYEPLHWLDMVKFNVRK